MKPMIIDKEGCIQDGDALVFIDYRSDRMREIVQTLGIKPPFETDVVRQNLHVVQMTEYSTDFDLPIMFPPIKLDNVLSEWISKKGCKQFHSAETEKYAHVTFFFNGGLEKAFDGEDRELIASPKVALRSCAEDVHVRSQRLCCQGNEIGQV